MTNNYKFEEGNPTFMQRYTCENSILITGIVSSEQEYSHEVFGEKFYKFTIEVKRLSDTPDLLPVTYSDRICDRHSLSVGVSISIIGQIRSYNYYVEQGNKLILTVFAQEIIVLGAEYKADNQQVAISGYICKAPVFRTTPFGRKIADILIAVNRAYKKSDYIPLIAWGRNARLANRLGIGDKISISGRMQSRSYQKIAVDGIIYEKTALEVSVYKIEKIDTGSY